MEPLKQTLDQKVWGISLMVAPLLFALSTFFWQNGEYGTVGGSIMVLSTVFWIPAFTGLFTLLKAKMPYYAAFGWMVAIYGCVGGSNFGFEGLYNAVYGISNERSLQTYSLYPWSFNLTLFWPGPLFPLSLLVLGINLVRCKSVQWWVGVLMGAAAVIFPLSRIPRIALMAHLADAVLMIPLVYIGWGFLQQAHRADAARKTAV